MFKTHLAVLVGLLLVVAVGQVWATNTGKLVSVGNWVFIDKDPGNVMTDPWLENNPASPDEGIPNVKVTLYVSTSDTPAGPWEICPLGLDNDGVKDGVTRTDASGHYRFEALPSDDYYMVVVDTTTLPAGLTQTYNRSDDLDGVANNSAAVSLVSSTEIATEWIDYSSDPPYPYNYDGDLSFDFGYSAPLPCSIGDRVWWDEDGLANQNETDAAHALNGWTVQLFAGVYNAANDTWAPAATPSATQVTGTGGTPTDPAASGGWYLFGGLAPGTWFVKVTPISTDWTQTYDLDGIAGESANLAKVTLAGGQNLRNVDFGYVKGTHDNGGGDLITVTQGGWGAKPSGNNPAAFLRDAFLAGTIWSVTIGNQTGGNYSLTFTSQKQIETFLPQGGTAKALTSSTNYSPKNVLAGQVLAMSLNLWFYDYPGTLKIASGPFANGTRTAADLLSIANRVLGGDLSALPAGMTISQLNDACTRFNENFDNGANKGFLIVPPTP